MLKIRLFCREMREVLCVVLSTAITLAPVTSCYSEAQRSPSAAANSTPPANQNSWGEATVDDKPFVFNELIGGLSEDERIQLANSLRLLPKIERKDFGKFGLRRYEDYADREEDVNKDKPLRPATFNQVSIEVIKAAIKAGRIPADRYISPTALKNGLLWVAYSKLRYQMLCSENINYHEIVQWVAKKKGLDRNQVAALPTFQLERKLAEKYFADIWDKLTPAQREELLKRIEQETNSQIANKAGIVLMGGGAAVAALGATVAFAGFAFYTTMSVVMCTVAGWFGITLPFAAYMGASSTVAVLAGPIGWCIAGGAIAGGAIYTALPSPDQTAAFVLTLHCIKAQKLEQQKQQQQKQQQQKQQEKKEGILK